MVVTDLHTSVTGKFEKKMLQCCLLGILNTGIDF